MTTSRSMAHIGKRSPPVSEVSSTATDSLSTVKWSPCIGTSHVVSQPLRMRASDAPYRMRRSTVVGPFVSQVGLPAASSTRKVEVPHEKASWSKQIVATAPLKHFSADVKSMANLYTPAALTLAVANKIFCRPALSSPVKSKRSVRVHGRLPSVRLLKELDTSTSSSNSNVKVVGGGGGGYCGGRGGLTGGGGCCGWLSGI